jgi:hypothetical protein
VILTGSEYNINNGIVFDVLQSLTLAGLAWAWINNCERVRDGRNAWKALIRPEASSNAMKQYPRQFIKVIQET